MAYAFRCNNCNSLAEAEHAGERDRPAKCATCGAGVRFTPDGIKSYDDDNWTILADLTDDELEPILEYHALSLDDISVHVPTPAVDPDHEPVSISVEAQDSTPAQKDIAR